MSTAERNHVARLAGPSGSIRSGRPSVGAGAGAGAVRGGLGAGCAGSASRSHRLGGAPCGGAGHSAHAAQGAGGWIARTSCQDILLCSFVGVLRTIRDQRRTQRLVLVGISPG